MNEEQPKAACCSVHAGGYEECQRDECEHESDGNTYNTTPEKFMCAKCGEYFIITKG